MRDNFESRFINARRKYFASQFAQLNDMQQEAVQTTQGPLLLLAGAGSGKPPVLISRIATLMRFGRASDSDEVPPHISQDDLDFLESLGDEPGEGDRLRADRICALDPAAPWSIIANTFTNNLRKVSG